MRRDRLPQHTDDQHPGQPVKEYGDSSQTLVDMLARRNKAAPVAPQAETAAGAVSVRVDDAGDTSGRKRRHDESDAIEDPSQSGPSKKARLEVVEVEETTEPKESRPTPTRTATAPSTSVDAKLDTILAQLSELKLSTTTSRHAADSETAKAASSATAKSADDTDIDALKTLIQNCKSIRRLCDLASLNIGENTLSCDVCCVTGLERLGVFKYDFLRLGVDFTNDSQPAAFGNLKRAVARHQETQTHVKSLMQREEQNERAKKMEAREQGAGITVGKQVYRLLKYGRPYADFEVDMLLLSDARVDVGNLNHSHKFPAALRPAFAEAVDQRVKAYMKQPLQATLCIPPVGIVADKVTTKRRTGQLFGAVLFTPSMPDLLTPVSLGITPVKKHDGESIANEICKVCDTYDINNDQIAGWGFDGQYFNLKVDEHLKTKLNLDESVGFEWDLAHILQLADKDTRKEIKWIDDICRDIAAVLSKFSFGKAFEAAVDKARELGVDLKSPLWFSDTRFAAFAYTVFKNFLDNYAVTRSVLEDVAASADARAVDADQLIQRMRTVDFVAKLLLCVDYYQSLATISRVLQVVNKEIWVKAQSLKTYRETLDKMAGWDQSHFKIFCTHEESVGNHEFAGFPLLVGNPGVILPRRRTRQGDDGTDEVEELPQDSPLHAFKRLGISWAEAMSRSMDRRFSDAFFDRISNKEKSASLVPILTAAKAAANESNFLASSEVETLTEMHPAQVEGARNLCQNIYKSVEILTDCDTDIDLYHKIFTIPSLYTGAQHVLSTLAKIMSSSPPESVVESMGSVVENIRSTRGGSKSATNSQDVNDLSEELIVHWNGPPINRCDSVVKQALNIHFKGAPWHFHATDVRSRLHKVSSVVDRLKKTPAKLNFMC